MDSFFYCFGQGVKNIIRNRLFSIASIATMTVCIFLFGIMYFMLVNVQYNMLELENDVGATVFFREGITEQELVDLKNKIVAIDGVRRIEYISADEAWTKFKETHFSDKDSDRRRTSSRRWKPSVPLSRKAFVTSITRRTWCGP